VLTHYLTFDKDRTGQLHTYVDAINRGEDLMGAATHTFGDLKQLDRDMDRYLHVNRFTYLKITSPDFNNIAVSVRPLRPGEAAIMPTQIRSARGVDKKTAPEVAALARAAASSYPSDPAVQRELAEAEFDAGNYAASRDAAVRTLAIDPKLEKALIYKGRAEMELASSDRKAGWNAIRQNFLDANKLDTEDAEPLFFYYESFARAGQGPTANAMAGLLYALDLAPQDKGLRMTAVAAMIAGGRLAEARAALAPIAFDPHSSKGREQARKIMDALGSKDEKTAMAALESFTPDDEE
jgi:tetratricopeptide (TPR) repeat protein